MEKLFNNLLLNKQEFLIRKLQILSGFYLILALKTLTDLQNSYIKSSFLLLLFILLIMLIIYYVKNKINLKKAKQRQSDPLFEEYYNTQQKILFNKKENQLLTNISDDEKIRFTKKLEISLYKESYIITKLLFLSISIITARWFITNDYKLSNFITYIIYVINSIILLSVSHFFKNHNNLKKITKYIFLVIICLSIIMNVYFVNKVDFFAILSPLNLSFIHKNISINFIKCNIIFISTVSNYFSTFLIYSKIKNHLDTEHYGDVLNDKYISKSIFIESFNTYFSCVKYNIILFSIFFLTVAIIYIGFFYFYNKFI
jgi:hypothetical protein